MKPKNTIVVNTQVSAQLGRTTGDADIFRLDIKDEKSRLTILTIEMDTEQFANLMSNRQALADGKVYQNPNIGKNHENKEFVYDIPKGLSTFTEAWKEWVTEVVFKDIEARGWIPDADGVKYNGHRSRNGKYSFTARRWV